MCDILDAVCYRISDVEAEMEKNNTEYNEAVKAIAKKRAQIEQALDGVVLSPSETVEKLGEAEAWKQAISDKVLYIAGFFDAIELMKERVSA